MSAPAPMNQHPISEGIRRAGTVAWAVVGILVLAGLAVGFIYAVREVLPPLVLALMLIFLLNPMVSWLERRRINRMLGTLGIYVLLIAVVVTFVIAIAPAVAAQIQELIQSAPEIQENLTSLVKSTAARFGASVTESDISRFFTDARDRLGSVGQIARISAGALHGLVIFVLAPIFALYVLIDLPKFQRSFVKHLPPAYREEWLMLLDRCGSAVGSFFRGQLLVATIVGVMSSSGFLLIGLRFWLPIGLLAGFFNIIPLVGPFVGGGVAVIVGAVTGGPGLALKAAIVMIVVQQIDNHFISPNVMGRAVRLHPVSVMVALLAGGTLAGLWGMLFSVPAMAVAKIVGLHFYETRVLDRPAMEPVPVEGGMIAEPGEREPRKISRRRSARGSLKRLRRNKPRQDDGDSL